MVSGIEKRVRDGKEEIFFKISAMPVEHFKRFKEFADLEWGGSYWHAIKFLLDFYEMTISGVFSDKSEESKKETKFLGGGKDEWIGKFTI